MPFEYDVFLSHNSKDKPAVEVIARKLQEKYKARCWLDKWNLVPGEPWQEALEEALGQCGAVAVFVGPNLIGPWENEEMRSALEARVHGKTRRVIPVLLPGAPDSRDVKLPRFLARLIWVDFRAGLQDEDALYRLYCGICGDKPGEGPENEKNGEGGSDLRNRKALKVTLITIWAFILAAIGIIGYPHLSAFIRPVTPVPSVTPTVTPTVIPENVLILIADFEDRSNGGFAGVDEGERIYNRIRETLPSDTRSTKVERLNQRLKDSEAAQKLLHARNAIVLIWGWYDSVGINLVVEINTDKISDGISKRSYQETQTNLDGTLPNTVREEFILASPESFVFSFAEQIPAKSAYVTFLSLGLLNFGTCKQTEALNYLTLAIQSVSSDDPIAWDGYLLLGEAYRCQNLYERSIEAYSKSIELNSTPEAFFGRAISKYYKVAEFVGDSCGVSSDVNGALADLEEAIRLNPKYSEAYWALGWLKNKQEHYEDALIHLNKSIELNPILARAYLNRGISYAGLEENEKAIEEFTRTIELNYHRPAIAYQNLAITNRRMAALDNALSNIDKAINLEPENYYLYTVRGSIYHQQGDLIKAEEDYITAVELNPKWGNYWLAYYYYEQSRYDEGISAMNQAIAIDPNCSVFYRRRAHYYFWGLEDHQAALDDADRAISLNPDLADAYNIRGAVYVNQKKYTAAIMEFEKALTLKKEDYFYCNLGTAYSRIGNYAAAKENLIKGVELDRDSSIPWCQELLVELQ